MLNFLFTHQGRGTVAVGTVQRGELKKGQAMELLGFGKKIKTSLSDLQVNLWPLISLIIE